VCGGGEVPQINPYFRAKPNCPFLKTDSLADTFFWTKHFFKKYEMLWGIDTQKMFFFSGPFFEKKFMDNFEKLFALNKFSKLFLNFFSKKVS
jgi:hypothetical protein